MLYANRTTVERTKAEIETTLTRYGADRFASYAESAVEGPTRVVIIFEGSRAAPAFRPSACGWQGRAR
jgi:hypothetical protein